MPLSFLSKSSLTIAAGAMLTVNALMLPSMANGSREKARQGLPGRRISGGVREGNCFQDFNQSLVAIMPRNNLGKTASERPSFWFSVPATVDEKDAEFQLFDHNDEQVYSTLVRVSEEQGLSEFKLPDSVPSLEVDKAYRWTFSVGCTDSSQFVVQGWVQRVNMTEDLMARVEAASLEEKVSLYSSSGLWLDHVSALMSLRQDDLANADLQIRWADLIASTGLTSYISSDITEAMSALETSALSASY